MRWAMRHVIRRRPQQGLPLVHSHILTIKDLRGGPMFRGYSILTTVRAYDKLLRGSNVVWAGTADSDNPCAQV